MNIKNLWGDLPEPDTSLHPATLLKEQGALLSEATRNLLQGEIIAQRKGKDLVATLRIKVPLLDNYRFNLCRLQYDAILLYPASIHDLTKSEPAVRVNNQEELEGVLAGLL